MALSRVCWARTAVWGLAVTPSPYVTRRLQLVRFGLVWGAPRWGTWRRKSIFWCTGPSSVSSLLACCLLVVRVPPLSGLGVFILLLRNRSPIPARDLASWRSELLVPYIVFPARREFVFQLPSSDSGFTAVYLGLTCLSLSCCSGLRPCAPSRLIPLPDVLTCLASPLPHVFFSVWLLISSWSQGLPCISEVSVYILWGLCLTLGTPGVKRLLGLIPR